MKTKLLGRWGEQMAAEYLKSKGYEILGMNYSVKAGEIDVIAAQGDQLAFVEVKLRKNADFARACESITPAKRAKLKKAAQLWLESRGEQYYARFDVIEIYTPEGAKTREPQINHIEQAFW